MPAQDKAAVRKQMLARRDALGQAERQQMSRRITDQVMRMSEFRAARTPLLFASFGSEVDTWPLIRAALQTGKRVVLPAVSRSPRCLRLRVVGDLERDLEACTWGIMEPQDWCEQVQPAELDFVLLPGVAFDPGGRRLGYGGGYYDRLMAQLTGQTPGVPLVAVAFEAQMVSKVPTGANDLPVPVIVTEERIITCCGAGGSAAAPGVEHEP